jgi:hypothetical protein
MIPRHNPKRPSLVGREKIERAIDELELGDSFIKWTICNLDGYATMPHRRLVYEVARLAEQSFRDNELTRAAVARGY